MFDNSDVGRVMFVNRNQRLVIAHNTDTSRVRSHEGGQGRSVARDVAAERGRRPPCEIPDDLSVSMEDGWIELQAKLITHFAEAKKAK